MMKFTLLGVLGLVSAFAMADDDLLPVNRPNFSSNAEVLPYKMMILETGTTYQRNGTALNFSGIEGFFRVGFQKDWEFDFTLPNYISGAAPRGWTDGGFNFIRALPSCHGWNMVVSFGSSLPTGQANLTAGALNPVAYFSADHDLAPSLQLTDTFFVNWLNSGGTFTPAYSNALMVSKDCGGGVGVFAELYSQFASHTQTTQTANLGVTFAHTKDQQADVHFGRNMSAGSGTNWFIGFGYSRKLSK